jgi:glucokinase
MAKRRVIGIDVGGTAVKLGAVALDDPPRALAHATWEGHTALDRDAALDELARRVEDLAAEAGWDAPEAVGLGLPGLVEVPEGRLHAAPNLLAWTDVPLADELSRRTGLPVRVGNDATNFARAEWLWGAGRGARHALFLTVGTGIGGGLVVDGRLLTGAHGFAGEPGHVTLDRHGPPCACGGRGCAELYLGNDAIVARARGRGDLDEVLSAGATPRTLAEAAAAGNRAAREVWNETGTILGDLLVGLVNVLDPERVIVGGGVGGAGELLLAPARDRLATASLVGREGGVTVAAAALGAQAGLLGSAGLWALHGDS